MLMLVVRHEGKNVLCYPDEARPSNFRSPIRLMYEVNVHEFVLVSRIIRRQNRLDGEKARRGVPMWMRMNRHDIGRKLGVL